MIGSRSSGRPDRQRLFQHTAPGCLQGTHPMKQPSHFIRVLMVFAVCTSLVQGFWAAAPAAAAPQPQDGSLTIEAIYGPNLIVDSNVESPSTYAPRSGTFAAKVCNTGATALSDV